MLGQDHDTKHASNSPVTFVTHKRFVVLFFLQSCCKLITIRVTFPPSLAPVPAKTNQCQRKLGWDLAGYAVEKKIGECLQLGSLRSPIFFQHRGACSKATRKFPLVTRSLSTTESALVPVELPEIQSAPYKADNSLKRTVAAQNGQLPVLSETFKFLEKINYNHCQTTKIS